MRKMHVEVQRNIKKLFKKLDIPAHVDRLLLHMLTLCKKTKQFKLWDVKFKISKNPNPGKKYLMKLEVSFLEPGEPAPAEKWWQRLFRWWRTLGMGDIGKRLKVKKGLKKLSEKEKQKQ